MRRASASPPARHSFGRWELHMFHAWRLQTADGNHPPSTMIRRTALRAHRLQALRFRTYVSSSPPPADANPPPTHQPPPPPSAQPAPLVSNTQPTLQDTPTPHSVSAAQRQNKNWPPSDAGVKYIFFGSFIVVPLLCWGYYEHRKEHMDALRHAQLKAAQERYRKGGGTAI